MNPLHWRKKISPEAAVPPIERRGKGHIIITGTGRAGTTFLVQLFSQLGFDTGFTAKQALTEIDPISHAGLELPLISRNSPHVLKSPWYCKELGPALRSGKIKIHAAILPMRNINHAAESRRLVHATAKAQGLDPKRHPGSVCMIDDSVQQESKLLEQFYEGLFSLVTHKIPIYLLEFPKTVQNSDYLFTQLENLLVEHGISREQFFDAHSAVARPELMHDFN